MLSQEETKTGRDARCMGSSYFCYQALTLSYQWLRIWLLYSLLGSSTRRARPPSSVFCKDFLPVNWEGGLKWEIESRGLYPEIFVIVWFGEMLGEFIENDGAGKSLPEEELKAAWLPHMIPLRYQWCQPTNQTLTTCRSKQQLQYKLFMSSLKLMPHCKLEWISCETKELCDVGHDRDKTNAEVQVTQELLLVLPPQTLHLLNTLLFHNHMSLPS